MEEFCRLMTCHLEDGDRPPNPVFLEERINEASELVVLVPVSEWPVAEGAHVCEALGGQAALNVTCQGLFVIFVPSDAGHRQCSSQESDCLQL